MLNTVAAGRRLAQRTAALQALVTLATALACLMSGREAALGALVGGGAMTLGGLRGRMERLRRRRAGSGDGAGAPVARARREVDGRDRRGLPRDRGVAPAGDGGARRRGDGRGRHVGRNETVGVSGWN